MKKTLFILAALLASAQAMALSTSDLARILSAPETAILADKNIAEIRVSSVQEGTTKNYEISLAAREAGLGLNGPDTHPCSATIRVAAVGGWAGITWTSPDVSGWICAANTPQ